MARALELLMAAVEYTRRGIEVVEVSRGAVTCATALQVEQAYATALAGACPLRPLAVNLLPADQRRSSSRMRYVPTLTLASLALIRLLM